MKLEDKKKLARLIKKREELAQKLHQVYTMDEASNILEFQLDAISRTIKKLALPPVKWKYGSYDNA